MSNPSNLYAEKVFAEQPNSLWSLDDKADYISLLSENQRDTSSWSIDGATVVTDNSLIYNPFSESNTTRISATLPDSELGQIVLTSQDIVNFNILNDSLSTFSIGSYVYAKSSYLTGLQIGYEYFDTTTGDLVQNLKNFSTSISDEWIFISETFIIPQQNTTLRLVLKIDYAVLENDPEDYVFYQNGFTLGQWSEEFHTNSLGVSPVQIPEEIATDQLLGVEAKTYGLSENSGYYFVSNNTLVAKNTGIPLVFGSSNVTKILPNSGKPSLILPGSGFLNEVGKYKDYTLEFWLRTSCDSLTEKRIVGPIGSDDGIYVNGAFIIIKVGESFGSHYVGQWERPMLINFRIGNNSANLVINGEQVIQLNYITEDLILPGELNENNKNQNWIGFYAYDDVSPIEIDCVGVYPYQVPSIVAKRRFVYGQGVEFPENINTAYSGTSIYIDYAFADYTNNYTYPDIGTWSQGTIDNLSVSDSILSIPEYTAPLLVLSDGLTSDLYEDCNAAQNEENLFFTFRPNSSWNESNGYIFMENFNLLGSETNAFYGIFKTEEIIQERQTLIRIEDPSSTNYFSIDLVGDFAEYSLFYNGEIETIYTSSVLFSEELFSVGLNIQGFSDYYGQNVAAFFGNKSFLKMYVGGTKNFTQSFTGKIYKVALCSAGNLYDIAYLFNQLGVPAENENIFDVYDEYIDYDGGYYNQTSWDSYIGPTQPNEDQLDIIAPNYENFSYSPSFFANIVLKEHTPSYALVASQHFNSFILDVNIKSYWEDHIPLSYFGKYITDENGDPFYGLDFIQFNIDFPAPSRFVEEETLGSWTYEELADEYARPVQKKYELLGNYLFTGYNDYSDLKNKSSKNYKYDTSNSIVKTYVTFQYMSSGANSNLKNFKNKISAPKNGIVLPGDEWVTTAYEVVDNMIIYPPKGVNFNDIALVTHIDIDIEGINYKPLRIRSLQYASQALDISSPNAIGTRFGLPIYPYKRSGLYYSYKDTNPFSIYKSSSPYLYMTRNSGIQLRGDYNPLINRGLSIPINAEKSSSYKVMAMQSMIRFDEDFFPYAPTQIFELESKNGTIKFYMVANDKNGKRAKIYAINSSTGQIENGIGFYWNGNLVQEPVMTIKEWGMLGISFSNILDFSNFVGSLRINGPIIINNISHYQSTNLQEVQKVNRRPWFKVKYAGSLELEWDFWYSSYFWNGVLVVSSTSYYGVNPSDIYKSFTGTNKVIVDDDRVFGINSYEYSIYQAAEWQSITSNAV